MRHLSKSFIYASLVMLSLSSAALAFSGGTGTPADPYLISTPAELMSIGSDSNLLNKCFLLTADIELKTVVPFTTAVIAPDLDDSMGGFQGTQFSGTFDGGGRTIWNLTIDTAGAGNDYLGLFGMVNTGATIKNVNIAACNITGGGGAYYVGCLVGENMGNIWNCTAAGTITLTGDDFYNVGGLLGWSGSSVDACSAAVDLTIGRSAYHVGGLCGCNYYTNIGQSCAKGNVTVDGYSYMIGGLVGWNRHSGIYNSYANGAVVAGSEMGQVGGCVGSCTDGTMSFCYSSGDMTVGDHGADVGGFLGQISSSSVTNCFWDVTTSDYTTSAAGTGKTTTEMKTLSTFTDAWWDFLGHDLYGGDGIWRMCANGVDYPRLTWEYMKNGDFACPDGVAMDDLALLADYWLVLSPMPFTHADATGEAFTNFLDFAILAAAWLD